MKKIPFKVSARTAKLIGQENFSNAEGATIELVKNSYDADATQCIVIFDILYPEVPEKLTAAVYKRISKQEGFVNSWYQLKGAEYKLSPHLTEAKIRTIRAFFSAKNAIYIIDNGTGMDENTIQDQWMEIGTGNKETKYKSDDTGRIKTGAKGIGRFALDRLGHLSEIYTVAKVAKGAKVASGFSWKMDWRQFEQPHRALTDINAELEEHHVPLADFLAKELKGHPQVLNLIKPRTFTHGTLIKITRLKDGWNEAALVNAHKSLEALVPPKDSGIMFALYFFHLQQPKDFGAVETAYFDDFDYRIAGDFDAAKLRVTCSITRSELDLKKVRKEFPTVFKKAKKPYDLLSLEKGNFTAAATVNEFLKWEPNASNKARLKRVGSFSFVFYFLKLRNTKEYPYRDFSTKERAAILEKFGGIKIYRDSFRVRPYGENGNDWLKLGERVAQSPAGAGQRIGDWRVGPNQIAGTIHISRIANPEIVDKSDRGSLVENETFVLFSKIIIGVLSYFETDRSIILHPFYLEMRNKEEAERKKKIQVEAEKIAQKLVKAQNKSEKVKTVDRHAPRFNIVGEDVQAYKAVLIDSLANLVEKESENAELAQMRGLASLGLIVSSFSHELKEIKNNAGMIDILDDRYSSLVPMERQKSREYSDGIHILRTLKRDNERMVFWINYALTAIKSDKRKRETIKFSQYFTGLKEIWRYALAERRIFLETKDNIRKVYDFRAFQVDMDTIFSNLISNSIDAFNNVRHKRERKIYISAQLVDDNIHIIYSDTGAGLASIFHKNKDEIFLPFVTSKKDKDGNNIGTGLGMYLVKSIVTDYGGHVQLMDPLVGFELKIDLPIRKYKGNGYV